MESGYLISLIILGVALIFLIGSGIYAMKKMKPTLKNIQKTQTNVEDQIEHFNNEADVMQKKVDLIMKRVDNTKEVAQVNLERMNELSDYASSLSHSLLYLKENGPDYSKGIAKNAYTEVKTDGPRLAKTFKRAFSKTIEKQKQRHQNNTSHSL
ncbi:MAG: DUF948 domain-containing protein [Alkalibacterium sp.]|uniref:Uncharacterized protein YoxC, contains an MCP-like domain n=1 Tax=Alkalibacterium gilvum TaxID=1130080 RepID=A0A1H6S7T9_9LACT|nr:MULTISPECIES: DUF948 domain-containing protein [Alkalibacterium]MDN6293178.1 DUF948 domain-containing protein [Alkalibacterium sp.]MDN6294819.1 DUF948 domain-containing protein [Alkalibacterium sp.]MDN6728852.1 DUF948 domain-containing protein [Alkalibacterium sp.]SEI64178.1 Uncharacterized protein YoxC, contains an MCP-like domain [Alkalibacterium gilvum]HAJ69706.1 DUF948 domain-containing protein [Alkalibacterium sp.]